MVDVAKAPLKSRIPSPITGVSHINDTTWESDSEGTSKKQATVSISAQEKLVSVMKEILIANYRSLPKRLLEDAVWLAPLSALWLFLWTIPNQTLNRLGPLGSLASLLIFLTATYNGIFGKAAFVTVFSRTILPLIKQKSTERTVHFAKYKKTLQLIQGIVRKGKVEAVKLILMSGGLGLIVSNILTRNNKIDKYFVCLLCSYALFDDMAKGPSNPVIRIVSAGISSIPMQLGQRLNGNLQTAYVAITGFAIGLAFAFVPGLVAQTFISPMGIIFGLVVLAIGYFLPKGGSIGVKQTK